jgi:hypothetical protein
MVRQYIPDDVKSFLVLNIPSVPFLEALLLLRNDDEHAWDARRLATRLYMSEKAAEQLLCDLCAAGILAVTEKKIPAYRYHPASDSLRNTIDRLADIYTRNIIEISTLIHAKSSKKNKS